MARTMNQFLCGCPIWFGVALIIAVNLVHNLFCIITVSLNIIFKIPTFGASDPPSAQVFNAAWCLLGMPFILTAIVGMWCKQESNMRLYLAYLSATFGLDLMFVVTWLVNSDLCGSMPRSIQRHGSAFACGFIRITSVGFALMMTVIIGYSVYCIWSYCEDLKAGGSGKGLDQLMQYQEQKAMQDAYSTFAAGVSNTTASAGTAVGTAFGAPVNKYAGWGGSNSIRFPSTPHDGKFHEVQFPPPPRGKV